MIVALASTAVLTLSCQGSEEVGPYFQTEDTAFSLAVSEDSFAGENGPFAWSMEGSETIVYDNGDRRLAAGLEAVENAAFSASLREAEKGWLLQWEINQDQSDHVKTQESGTAFCTPSRSPEGVSS